MALDIPALHKESGAFWDEIAGWYGERDEAEATEFLRGGGSFLLESEKSLLGDLVPWCKRAIHLQCSRGDDSLSLWRQGAAQIVGVDISPRLLAVARRKGEALGAPATWECCDVLETPTVLNGTANLVYTGRGALCWMMDLAAWAAVAARLLAPGGRLFVHESHPLDWVWDMEAAGYVLDREHGDYFSRKPRERLFSDTEATPRYRQWTLGQIVNSVVGAGLVLDQLHEYPQPFWEQFPNIPADNLCRLPHAFALLAHKPENRMKDKA